MASTFQRLSADADPIKYNISLNVDLEQFTFQGKQVVTVDVKQPTNKLTLNSLDLEVTSLKYNEEVGSVTYDKDNETVQFEFPSNLPIGTGNLYIEFTAILKDHMKGFYRSSFDHNGETKYMATTQFEPTDARRAFPCWDEPARKAVFQMDITADKRYTVLNNTPEIRREAVADNESRQTVYFEPTPIMSTYLVAFVVSELDFVEDHTDGVKVRVYTTPGNAEKGRFALDIACRTLPFYKEYFAVAYPLPKLDLIAIPDFAAGAMENWGLITYRETALLVDPKESSAAGRQRVAIVVGHELAHQWFGNLVTMEWWTDLWLNEGFASWIEYLAVDYCCPDFDIWTQFVADDFSDALELDALKSSHPIEVEVSSPAEIDEIFDRISYSKGACIIRMLRDHMGADVFKKGLQLYLSKYKYSNARTADLWRSLEEATNGELPVAQIMSTWTDQMGFPVVTVSAGAGGERSLKFSQKRFLSDGSEDTKSLWKIPITLCKSDDPKGTPILKFLLDEAEKEITLPENCSADNVRVNPLRMGFYRVHYNHPAMFQSLKSAVSSLTAVDRLAIANDAFALSRSGWQPVIDFLSLVPLYANEKDYTVWADLVSSLTSVKIIAEEVSEECGNLYQAFLMKTFEPIYLSLGWHPKPNDKHTDELLRAMVLTFLGKLGHQDILETGRALFEKHVCGDSRLNSNLRAAVYSMVMKHGDQTKLQQLEELLKSTDLQEERIRILRAMGNAPLDLLPHIHSLALDSNKVRKQDCVFVLLSCCHSRLARLRTWNYVKTSWPEVYGCLKGLFLLGHLVQGLVENFASDEMHDDVKQFFDTHDTEGCQRAVQQALETIRLNISMFKRDGNELLKWLQSN